MKFRLKDLRYYFKKWLFKEELEQIAVIRKMTATMCLDVDKAKFSLSMANGAYREAKELAENAQRMVNKITDVGVDIGFRDENHSWAVVCIKGKTDYVKFIPLGHKDAKDIVDFLRKFQYSNQTIDSPIGYKHMIQDYMMKGSF